jgi:hypothetical protein
VRSPARIVKAVALLDRDNNDALSRHLDGPGNARDPARGDSSILEDRRCDIWIGTREKAELQTGVGTPFRAARLTPL